MLSPFISSLPIDIPPIFYTALEVIKAFTHCVTPSNPSLPRYSSLAATFTCNLAGNITGASLALSTAGIDTQQGLLSIPAEAGYRAFDVFYYLDSSSATEAEREALNLRAPSLYSFLKRSGTFNPPPYLPTVDDAASAEEFRHNLRALGIKGVAQRNLIMLLAGLLKLGDSLSYLVDEEALDAVCEDVAVLLDVDKDVLRRKCSTEDRQVLIAGLYEAAVDWVIGFANESIRSALRGARAGLNPDSSDSDAGIVTPNESEEFGDSVSISVIDIPGQNLSRAIALRTVFDDTDGINAEMKEDGVHIQAAGTSVLREMQ
ncbi:hypothetical protein LTS18_000885, partial [Coniosporium uncinatum]